MKRKESLLNGCGFRLAGLCLIEFIDLVLQSETLDFYGDIKDG